MKKPTKPTKPIKPKTKINRIDKIFEITDQSLEISLKEIRDMLPDNCNDENIIIEIFSDVYDAAYVSIKHKRLIDNPNLDQETFNYDAQMEVYKEAIKHYNNEIKKYNEQEKEENKRKLREIINRAEDQLKRLS